MLAEERSQVLRRASGIGAPQIALNSTHEQIRFRIVSELIAIAVEDNPPFEQHGNVGHVARIHARQMRPEIGNRFFACVDAVEKVQHVIVQWQSTSQLLHFFVQPPGI